MSIKTILDNLFGRVMKNGKRIPGTCILAFGTRIFFDDYLLPDDIIICTDWTDYASVRMRRKYKHVEFLSESEVKKMVDKGTLYNYIERKYKMRKFDLVVSNPPYDGDLHLQILDVFLKISKQCVFVHPARWMEDVLAQYKAKSATGKKFEHLKTALTQVYLVKAADAQELFHIDIDQDEVIGVYDKSDMNPILPIYDDAKRFFYVMRNVVDYALNIKSLKDVCEEKKIDGIRVEIKTISPRSHAGGGCKSFLARNSFVTVVGNKPFEDGKNEHGEPWHIADGKAQNQHTRGLKFKLFPSSIKFDSIVDANTFIELYKSNTLKNIVHMFKYDMNACHTYIPYFDPKTIKTEDNVLDALGITKPEYREWLKRDVYDYREKDFIKYNEWIDC